MAAPVSTFAPLITWRSEICAHSLYTSSCEWSNSYSLSLSLYPGYFYTHVSANFYLFSTRLHKFKSATQYPLRISDISMSDISDTPGRESAENGRESDYNLPQSSITKNKEDDEQHKNIQQPNPPARQTPIRPALADSSSVSSALSTSTTSSIFDTSLNQPGTPLTPNEQETLISGIPKCLKVESHADPRTFLFKSNCPEESRQSFISSSPLVSPMSTESPPHHMSPVVPAEGVKYNTNPDQDEIVCNVDVLDVNDSPTAQSNSKLKAKHSAKNLDNKTDENVEVLHTKIILKEAMVQKDIAVDRTVHNLKSYGEEDVRSSKRDYFAPDAIHNGPGSASEHMRAGVSTGPDVMNDGSPSNAKSKKGRTSAVGITKPLRRSDRLAKYLVNYYSQSYRTKSQSTSLVSVKPNLPLPSKTTSSINSESDIESRIQLTPNSKTDPPKHSPDFKGWKTEKSENDVKLEVLRVLRQKSTETKSKMPSFRTRYFQTWNSIWNDNNKSNTKDGFIYIFECSSFPEGYVKIGHTDLLPEERLKAWEKQCSILISRISDPHDKKFRHHEIVEALVHAELWNKRRTYQCWCNTNHIEWFEIRKEEALAVVEKWRSWVINMQPYKNNGSLRARWIWKHDQAMNSKEIDLAILKQFTIEDTHECCLYAFRDLVEILWLAAEMLVSCPELFLFGTAVALFSSILGAGILTCVIVVQSLYVFLWFNYS